MWKCKKIVFALIFDVLFLFTGAYGEPIICSSLCRCVNESHFVKVHCDFIDNKEYTLDDGLKLPFLSNALNITLGVKSRLVIKKGFFASNNRINSLNVQGSQEILKLSQAHVELWKNSLNGIWGNFPEISFKSLKNVVMFEKSLDGLLEINLIVENIWQLEMHKEVFGTTSFNASFSDVADLSFAEGALTTTSLNLTKPKIFISRSWIRNLLPLRGKKLTELRIENSEIETIQSSAFNILELHSLVLDNVRIQLIERDIFREGIAIDNMAVMNCKIDKIETKAIHDVGITKFTFSNNIVNLIDANSMEFDGSSIEISNNKINFLGSNWLKSIQWHRINILNNTFGSFDSVTLENPTSTFENVYCSFHHNSFTEVSQGSFMSTSEKCQFTELLFKQNCACNFHQWLEKLFPKSTPLKKIQSESFCSLDPNDTLLRCLKAETVKYEQYHDEICSRKKSKLKCERLKVDKMDVKFIDSKVLTDDFEWRDYLHYLAAVGTCIVFLFCACVIFVTKRRSRNVPADPYGDGTLHRQTNLLQLNQSEGPPSYEASLRSTKLFSNRDREIIERTLETMKKKHPGEKYEMVFNNTKRLLNEHPNEYEKVRIIGDIVQTIGECENSGEDFVAFTDILYKHLAPEANVTLRTAAVSRPQQPNDSLYAEPIVLQNALVPSRVNSEHIYAEPAALSQQQQTMTPLLLSNNYSSPMDSHTRNSDGKTNYLYSEPVLHENASGISTFRPNMAIPYAISSNIRDQPGSTNLPDIVNRTEPGPSGELYRITRSPTTNRKIPEYTVPSTSQKTPLRVTQETIEDWSDESMENSTSSKHSGGSNATVTVDELIDYADSGS